MRTKFKVESISPQGPVTVVQLALRYRKYEDPNPAAISTTFDTSTGLPIPPEPVLAYVPKEGVPFDALRDGARGGSITVVCYTPEAAAAFEVGKTFWLVADEE